MAKVFVHLVVLVMLFFGTWFLLGQINFIELFDVEQLTRDNERRIGELIINTITKGHDELESDSIQTFLISIKKRLCQANNIKDSSITLHVIIHDDVNAFALPDRNLVVYTGLIRYCDSAEELSGVFAHEISHIEHHHVMKKLVKEIGLSMLRTIAGGESGGEIMKQTVKLLSSTAFDREQEREADISAVHMMARADIDPKYLANFLFRLSQEKDNIPKNFEWLSTHPNSQDRSAEILQLRKQEVFHDRSISDNARWTRMKDYAGGSQKKLKR